MKYFLPILTLVLFTFMSSVTYGQVQIGNDIDGIKAGDFTGGAASMSADGSRVAVGSPSGNSNTGPGRVNVYELQNGTWTQIGSELMGSDSTGSFGADIDLSNDGNRLIIGAYDEGMGDRGAVSVYEWLNNDWSQVGSTLEGDMSNEDFGFAVAISGDGLVIAVGDPMRDDVPGGNPESGQVVVYGWANNMWNQIGPKFDLDNNNTLSLVGWIGYSVDLSANGMMVAYGAPNNIDIGSNTVGGVAVYEFVPNMGWFLVDTTILSTNENNVLGTSIALTPDGQTIAVSAPNMSGSGSEAGSIKVYEVTGGGGNWQPKGDSIIGPVNAGMHPNNSLAISDNGDRVVFGDPGFGANPDEERGQIKVYDWSGSAWTQWGADILGAAGGMQAGTSITLSADGTRMAEGTIYAGTNGEGRARVYDLTVVSSLEGLAQHTALEVYPNPTKGMVHFQLESSVSSDVTLSIMNPLGQIISTPYQGAVRSGQTLEVNFDTKVLSAGMYTFQLLYSDGSLQTGKIIRSE